MCGNIDTLDFTHFCHTVFGDHCMQFDAVGCLGLNGNEFICRGTGIDDLQVSRAIGLARYRSAYPQIIELQCSGLEVRSGA